jgi:hypothetical protein
MSAAASLAPVRLKPGSDAARSCDAPGLVISGALMRGEMGISVPKNYDQFSL